MHEVTTGIREKGINIIELTDREEWSGGEKKKPLKLQVQKDEKTLVLCTEINKNNNYYYYCYYY